MCQWCCQVSACVLFPALSTARRNRSCSFVAEMRLRNVFSGYLLFLPHCAGCLSPVLREKGEGGEGREEGEWERAAEGRGGCSNKSLGNKYQRTVNVGEIFNAVFG